MHYGVVFRDILRQDTSSSKSMLCFTCKILQFKNVLLGKCTIYSHTYAVHGLA